MKTLQTNVPPLAEIYDIVTTNIAGKIKNKEFKIYKSTKDTELSGSVIPPDIAICNKCLSELKDPKNKRYNYCRISERKRIYEVLALFRRNYILIKLYLILGDL